MGTMDVTQGKVKLREKLCSAASHLYVNSGIHIQESNTLRPKNAFQFIARGLWLPAVCTRQTYAPRLQQPVGLNVSVCRLPLSRRVVTLARCGRLVCKGGKHGGVIRCATKTTGTMCE